MPTYDYHCEACGADFELFQSIKAAPIRKCPECGKRRVRRLIGTGAGIIFKGTGFYATDYRSDSYKQDATKDAGGEKSSDAPAEKKADKKDDSQAKKTPRKADSSD